MFLYCRDGRDARDGRDGSSKNIFIKNWFIISFDNLLFDSKRSNRRTMDQMSNSVVETYIFGLKHTPTWFHFTLDERLTRLACQKSGDAKHERLKITQEVVNSFVARGGCFAKYVKEKKEQQFLSNGEVISNYLNELVKASSRRRRKRKGQQPALFYNLVQTKKETDNAGVERNVNCMGDTETTNDFEFTVGIEEEEKPNGDVEVSQSIEVPDIPGITTIPVAAATITNKRKETESFVNQTQQSTRTSQHNPPVKSKRTKKTKPINFNASVSSMQPLERNIEFVIGNHKKEFRKRWLHDQSLSGDRRQPPNFASSPVDTSTPLPSNASPSTRTLFYEALHNQWKWSKKNNQQPWHKRDWVRVKVTILDVLGRIRKELQIKTPRMDWETWAEVIVERDKQYLPDNFDLLSPAQQKREIDNLRVQRLLICMLATPLKLDEAVFKNTIQVFIDNGWYSLSALAGVTTKQIAYAIRAGGMQHKTACQLMYAALVVQENGGYVEKDPLWIMALHGVGPKICSVVMKAGFGVDIGIPTDSHAFGIARADQMVYDGDITEAMVALRLQEWLPKSHWYLFNMEMASLGQVLDRGEEQEATRFINALLEDDVTKHWIIRICTSPLYVDRATKYILPAIAKDKTLSKHVLCKPKSSLKKPVII